MIFFLKGVLIGFSVAAPVGAIGLLCIQRTLVQSRLSGFLTGLGAAFANAIYGVIAGIFGAGLITQFLVSQERLVHLISGVFLIYMGVKMIRSVPPDREVDPTSKGLLANFLSSFFLLITNPSTILFFLAVFGTVGVPTASNQVFGASVTICGIFMGSVLWWLTLVTVTHLLKNRINRKVLSAINKIAGLIIVGFGVTSCISSF
ncbi:LysE family translocator [Tumebacillus lipolyticus]|uniref:LysE family translocator n=1 Tax=Tumebacillus lipolyticus TaxID=1280370 RepID=A0ABW4ZUA4_9BACL